jgi:hypothetical protein
MGAVLGCEAFRKWELLRWIIAWCPNGEISLSFALPLELFNAYILVWLEDGSLVYYPEGSPILVGEFGGRGTIRVGLQQWCWPPIGAGSQEGLCGFLSVSPGRPVSQSNLTCNKLRAAGGPSLLASIK